MLLEESMRFRIAGATVALLALLEGFSLASFWYPQIEVYGMAFFVLACVWLSIKRIEYGLMMIFAELIVSSFGRMLAFEQVSIRMALFAVVMSMWLIRHVPRSTQAMKRLCHDHDASGIFGPLFLMAIMFSGSFLYGIVRGHDLSAVVQDANGYVFFLLFLPVLALKSKIDFYRNLLLVVTVALSWLIAKSLLIFIFFTHVGQPFFDLWQYQWLRDMRIAEITPYGGGLVRVFLQSHIYVALAFIVLLAIPLSMRRHIKPSVLFALLVGCSSVLLLSLSRSMWLGVGCAGLMLIVWLLVKKRFAIAKYVLQAGSVSLVAGYVLLSLLYGLPYGENTRAPLHSLFVSRVQAVDTEVAAASRWEQLPILLGSITEQPVFGHGFGKTLTISNPHDASISEDRFAFEWGWLDLWTKVGVVGVILYTWFIYRLASLIVRIRLSRDGLQIQQGLISVLIAFVVINVFTPYINHPLGIGCLMFIYLIQQGLIQYGFYEKLQVSK